jgi:hypothetical protein
MSSKGLSLHDIQKQRRPKYEDLSTNQILAILYSRGIEFDTDAPRRELIEILKKEGK